MAASRGLNPRAPAYIPLSYPTQTPFTNFPPLPPHIHHFPFSSPPPPSFFPTASQSPLLHPQSPLYTTPYPIHPLPPPPPRVVEPPPVVPSTVGPETGRIGGPRRRPRAVTCGSRGTTSGFRSSQHHHHQKEPNFGRRFNSNNKFGNTSRAGSSSCSRIWERRRGSTLKKYEVLPLSHCEEKTTVMIKNIPKLYRYVILPSFKYYSSNTTSSCTGCSRGFAFVNFTEARAVWKFLRACNGKTWDLFQSPKICEIVCAKIQLWMFDQQTAMQCNGPATGLEYGGSKGGWQMDFRVRIVPSRSIGDGKLIFCNASVCLRERENLHAANERVPRAEVSDDGGEKQRKRETRAAAVEEVAAGGEV
ncbi:hypothetical protein RHGRI_032841 [Rhododendron griersonianum]|uniref:Mei2-like C-terminal RNA recognition motif domain-containing protein n=1 Tax=Rhododendron griersonianum TaxID=479676 RepID=A0AAV6IJ82_9ERIC|nr:hypothetical protein RHGRI_032841 [Rhododendron griersonianum]